MINNQRKTKFLPRLKLQILRGMEIVHVQSPSKYPGSEILFLNLENLTGIILLGLGGFRGIVILIFDFTKLL